MSFLPALDRVRRWQRLGRLMAAVLAAFAAAPLLVLLLGLADAWTGFEPGARQALVTTAGVIALLVLVAGLVIALRFSRGRASALADRLADAKRHSASAALSLSRLESGSALSRYLTQRSLDDASILLNAMPGRRLIAWRPLARAAAAVILCLLPVAILAAAAPRAFQTIAHRLANPSADLPPWSRLDFAVVPAEPTCVYGGELDLAVEITGGELEFPVECLVRRTDSSEVSRLPAFRESATQYSRTLEGVTEPIEVAFACGRARSGWHPVELLLQPKVLAGKVTITPPAYTERPPVETPLDRNEIAALQGSEIVLELTSNRPLAPSSLVITPATTPGNEALPRTIEGEPGDTNRITFRWTADATGRLSVTLRDVRGTPASSPVELALRAVPDQPPAVDLTSPPRLLLATPTTRIPLKGNVEDDNALARVQFVRTLQGFRDRARMVAPSLRQPQYQFSDKLDLGNIGVTPGQTIELFLEASDHNPSLLGQGASEISRIQIISEEEYAYRIRAKTTLAEFSTRFRALNEALREAREALDALDRAADLNDADAMEKARQQAADAHKRSAEMLEKLADDFPAFEIEKRLQEIAREQAGQVGENMKALDNFDPKAPEGDQRRAIREMRERLGGGQEKLNQLQQDAQTLAEAGKILEMAAKFQQIYLNQVSVAQRIHNITKEIAKGDDSNRRLLPSLGETQRKNREALDEFAGELKKRAEAIRDPALAPLKSSSLEFLERLALSDPGSVMDLATESARLGKANDAFVSAELARGMLESLMSQNDPFCNACKGSCPKFSIPRPDVNETMRQLLEGMMCQNPGMSPNQGFGGGGMGLGGTGPTGNAQPGFANLDNPVVGPEPMFFQPPSMDAEGRSGGDGQRGNPLDQASETETMKPVETPRVGEASPDLENVPAAYREAVKAYFTPEN